MRLVRLLPPLLLLGCASSSSHRRVPAPPPSPAPSPAAPLPPLLDANASWTRGHDCKPEPMLAWTLDAAHHTLAADGATFQLPDGWTATLETPRVAVILAPTIEGRVRDAIELAIARPCAETDEPSVVDRMARRALRESIAGEIAVPAGLAAAMGAPWESVSLTGAVHDVPLWLITTTFARDSHGTYVLTAAAGCAATGAHQGRCHDGYVRMIESGVGTAP